MSYKKLDPDFKTKWVKALRSGRFKQTKATLRDDHYYVEAPDKEEDMRVSGIGYCCLGVACNIINPRAWKPAADKWDSGFDWGDLAASTTRGLPFCSAGVGSHLANMNDKGRSFDETADWIEAKL